MEIHPVNKYNASEQVYNQMLSMILSGTYKFDERLPSENKLKDLFQVSRHTVRSVMNRFYAMGLIETIPGDGTYLKRPGNSVYTSGFLPSIAFVENDIFEVMEYRIAIETESARLCTARATPEDLKVIECELNKLEQIRDDKVHFAQSDINFHVEIAKASKNAMIYESMKIVRDVQNAKMSEYIMKTEIYNSDVEHREIFEAIQSGQSEKAAEAMYHHLTAVINRFRDVQQHLQEK